GPRGWVRFLALYVLPRTPRGIKSGAEPASKVVDAAAFAQDRDRAIQLLRQLAAQGQTHVPEHPAFGQMTRGDWLRYGYLHTDHHLRQFGL
ncbi:MAG: DinB family protein, partial [Gemmatimonadota bacterium]|nr:DinB family protein [Gemmatimonadota bacterium]